MSFYLERAEHVDKAIKRIVRAQLEDGLDHLRQKTLRDEAVHEIRKDLKRIRAVLRLVRDDLGEDVYRRENTCFRDAGRPLTEVRDARVLLETLEQLAAGANGALPARTLEPIRKGLQRHYRAVRKQVVGEQDAAATVKKVVQDALERLDDWPIEHDGWAAVGSGIRAVYKKGCRAFAASGNDASAETWHEWRKQAKYLWHQVQVLEPLWEEVLNKLGDEVHRLTQILGDDHDLFVLHEMLVKEPERYGPGPALEVVLALSDRRRQELRQQARPLGERIYLDSPGAFADRLHGYWKAWRAEPAAPTADA